MSKPIIKIKRSTLGTSIVIRSPFSRRWLMNITLAPKRKCDHLWFSEKDGSKSCLYCPEYKRAPLSLEWMPGYTVAKAGMVLTLLSILVLTLTGCADTKTDSIYIFLDCATRDQLKAERE